MTQKGTENRPDASPPRRRLLDAAIRLFYEEGIHAVGIDRIIAEAGVAKASFYKHFPSKEDLVVGYLEEVDQLGRAAVEALPDQAPRQRVSAIMDRIGEAVVAGGWRGCPFLNAAAEYPDPASPVRQLIDARRAWHHASLQKLLTEDGDPQPALTASLLVALSDGLLEGAYLDDAGSVPALVREGVARLLERRS